MDCIFCKIVKSEIPCFKIWENKKYIAILDINPNVEGMTLLITKRHYPSYAIDMSDEKFKSFFLAAKRVAKILDKNLGVKRTAIVMEGLGVDHAHIKLYPVHGLDEKFQEIWAKEKVYFNKYPGYITTQLGPKASEKDLKSIQKKIRKDVK